MQSAWKYSKLMLGTQRSETKTTIHRFLERHECYRCGSINHLADSCQFKNKECFKHRRISHTHRKCRQEEDRPSSATSHNRKKRTVNNVDASYVEERDVNMEKLDLHTVALLRTPPVQVELLINKKLLMEVDTGTSCSVMSLSKFKEMANFGI